EPDLDLQLAVPQPVPSIDSFRRWAGAALAGRRDGAELTVRVVSPDESAALNAAYRGKDAPTNVLSFAAELPPPIDVPLLGDLVICAALVEREAREQGKTLEAHWAHLVVHGCLHLLGFDHGSDAEAREMEGLETVILAELGYPDPYGQRRTASAKETSDHHV
ncbi:MAG: rRNA maturation RNase YbeY, partial [Pseudomonadota bacterium]